MNRGLSNTPVTEAHDDAVVVSAGSADHDTTVADGQHHPLHANWVLVARLAGAIQTAAVSLALLVGVVIVSIAAAPGWGITLSLGAAWVALAGFMAGWSYAWPAIQHRRTRYRVDANGMTIRRGVVWRSVTSVPKARVQHTDVVQGPLQRRFELATLVIHTAGTQDASVSLSGLPHDTARRIRDFLIDESDDVGA